MKKYMKPEIVFEDFTISTNIASGCDREHGPTSGMCAVYPGTGDVAFFNVSADDSQCSHEPIGGDFKDNDGFCYHVPDGGPSLFTSG